MNASMEIPPPDYYRNPDCPLCGTETKPDWDGVVCDPCRVRWPGLGLGERGSRLDDHLPQCTAECSPHADSPYRYRCVRNEGHKYRHAGIRVDEPDSDNTYSWE